jgi:hypothetical protein
MVKTCVTVALMAGIRTIRPIHGDHRFAGRCFAQHDERGCIKTALSLPSAGTMGRIRVMAKPSPVRQGYYTPVTGHASRGTGTGAGTDQIHALMAWNWRDSGEPHHSDDHDTVVATPKESRRA